MDLNDRNTREAIALGLLKENVRREGMCAEYGEESAKIAFEYADCFLEMASDEEKAKAAARRAEERIDTESTEDTEDTEQREDTEVADFPWWILVMLVAAVLYLVLIYVI